MSAIPILKTQRLILRGLTVADAPAIQRLAGDHLVAATTLLIPHPYPDGAAEEWIAKHEALAVENREFIFGITLTGSGEVIGAIEIENNKDYQRGSLGYWVGVPYWGKGYCTEAARAVTDFGFATLALHRVCSCHFGGNIASGRVMQKLGMQYEGTRRDHFKKWEGFKDQVNYGLLRDEWEARRTA